jgi:hypothetical protein
MVVEGEGARLGVVVVVVSGGEVMMVIGVVMVVGMWR